MTSHDPKPVDEQPEPEIRGGNRPADYIPLLEGKDWVYTPVAHEDHELEDGAESYPEDDPDAQ